MNHQRMVTLLVAFATSVLLSQDLFAQQCSNPVQVTYNWIYYQPPNGATRHPTRTAGYFSPVPGYGSYTIGVIPIAPDCSSIYVSPATTQTIHIGTITYELALTSFWSGGQGGGITVLPGANTSYIPVPAQQSAVVNYVYFPFGDGCQKPPCPTYAIIDEFSETSGQLANDDFVTVFSPQTATTADQGLTNKGNDYGLVDTTQSGVRINAYDQTQTGQFDEWATSSGGTVGKDIHDLTVAKGTIDYALALYHSCPDGYSWKPVSPFIRQCSRNQCRKGFHWDDVLGACVKNTPDPGPCWNPCKPPSSCIVWGYECNCLRCSDATPGFPYGKDFPSRKE
jgi:hypothetical protein